MKVSFYLKSNKNIFLDYSGKNIKMAKINGNELTE